MPYDKIPQILVDALPMAVAYTKDSLQETANRVVAVGRFLLDEHNRMNPDAEIDQPLIVSQGAAVPPTGHLTGASAIEALGFLNGHPLSPGRPYLSWLRQTVRRYNRILRDREDGKDARMSDVYWISSMGREMQELVWAATNAVYRQIQLDAGRLEGIQLLDPPK